MSDNEVLNMYFGIFDENYPGKTLVYVDHSFFMLYNSYMIIKKTVSL